MNTTEYLASRYEQPFVTNREQFTETEQKLICPAHNAFEFEQYKEFGNLELIEQVYLSHLNEPYSLRLRESTYANGHVEYSAALKSTGEPTDQGLRRDEIETPITREIYEYYTLSPLPVIHKMRAYPAPNISIDWIEGMDTTPLIEIEHSNQPSQEHQDFINQHGHLLAPVTSPYQTMEELAHNCYAGNSSKSETPPQAAEIIARIDIERIDYAKPIVVGVTGRSGSGKSTIIREVVAHYKESLRVATLSTDDYHRGKTWLEAHNNGQPWENWELPIVYDTAELAGDLSLLIAGNPIPRQTIDFGPCERVITGEIVPADVIIVEGLHAGSPDISSYYDITVDITTPLATCIGRRVYRDLQERPEFADPSTSLRYILETVEPAYREQIASLQSIRLAAEP